ncbi:MULTISPECIES: energy-coupling factor ABC transporter ATP-binding protein [Aminobacterium]|jgi:tungstate transport system ATP-binding protein|uniref:energy-coupling factor ABC transporter ATP-binding protein n=1 Tax=Aminobacterium TaxID=81466 RepID=UPI00046392A8|nr:MULTISPECIES: ATP-binding cassette domain-containing protein [Aminobacterium]
MKTLYSLQKIRHYYKNHCVLDIQGLEIYSREIVGILGPNGSGKSTLLRILAFLETPVEGHISFKGQLVSDLTVELRRSVTLLLQDAYLLKRSVRENVGFGLKVRGIIKKEREQRIAEALSVVGLDPVIFASRKWFELSGGEAQRVALASRLVLKPEVLLLDEPTASVDKESADLIQHAIKMCRERWGTTLLLVSHNAEWVKNVSDRLIFLSEGCIEKDIKKS